MGDGDPFPLKTPVGVAMLPLESKWIGAKGTYTAHQIGAVVVVSALIELPVFGRAEFSKSLLTVYPPEFVATVLSTAPEVLSGERVTKTASFVARDTIAEVIVHDRDGAHRVSVKQAVEASA